MPISETYEALFDGPHATPPPSDEGPIFLGINNITDDGHLNLNQVRHIAEEDFARWTKRVTPQPGDIVFTYEATLNRYAMIPPGFRGCLGRRLALIRPDPEKADPKFLFYYLFGREWRETIATNTISGATVERIPLVRFPEFPVALPSMGTQQEIAAILSAHDELIENNNRRIRILEEMARALYREWYVEFRFPGHEKAKFVDSPIGKIPEGWFGSVWELAELGRQGVNPSQFPDEEFQHFSIPAYDDSQRPAVERGSAILSQKYLLTQPCVLISKLNPRISRAWRVNPTGQGRSIASTEFLCLTPKSGVTLEFLFLKCSSPDFVSQFAGLAVGTSTSHQRVKPQVLLEMPAVLPDHSTIRAFSALTSPMMDLADVLRTKNHGLSTVRDLLLPRLISGEIDAGKLKPTAEAITA